MIGEGGREEGREGRGREKEGWGFILNSWKHAYPPHFRFQALICDSPISGHASIP